MSSTVKSLKVTYNPINEKNTFTSGDLLCGQVALEVAKDCQIESLSIKFKGKAEVLWTERHGQTTVVYHSKDKYFSQKHYFIRDKNHTGNDNQTLLTTQHGDTYSSVVAPGCHVYPFTFQIPFQELPSSFNGSVGKIVYLLEAKLSRSMRIDKKDSTKINFVSKADLHSVPGLMTPQHESKDKKMKVFTSGTVAMDVDIEKSGFFQGEGLKVLAFIQNNSSREIKPKYCVYRKHSFFANGKRRVDTKDLVKEVGEPIPPSASEKVTRVITIPHDLEPSIFNCNIIKAEYRLRVYLDVKYASDPEIKFPIMILPAFQFPAAAPLPAAAGFGLEPFGNPVPPAWGIAPPQPPVVPQPFDLPPPYGDHGMYPPLTGFGNKYQ
ncbi:arrestin domain-containing protein 3-like [Toxotes jaculatrix]|uniref:arrestin domain-containing protein 3-like n=1 Tax=Toxotes jaculatrix TaxID=941984 RepID=UPI001B3AFFC8|nr:arrestin domain-containing protein 3-like [Toxotes jaculatrix]